MNENEYLLTLLSEECAEVAQRVSKALRFGLNEIQPGQPHTNSRRIYLELIDLIEVVDMLDQRGILDLTSHIKEDEEHGANKRRKILEYMEYSRKMGCLT